MTLTGYSIIVLLLWVCVFLIIEIRKRHREIRLLEKEVKLYRNLSNNMAKNVKKYGPEVKDDGADQTDTLKMKSEIVMSLDNKES